MQKIFGFLVIFTILISFTASQQEAFADSYTIKPASGSGAPGCEEKSSGCYLPSVLTINEGDSIKFINTDSSAHTITSGDPTIPETVQVLFDSGMIMANQDYSFKLSESGVVPYFCMLHPWMQGLIVVESSSSSSNYTPPTPTYTPPTSSGTDWQGKYFEVLSDFNDVSSKVGELQRENRDLKAQVADLERTINDLNTIVMEQVKVIYEWVLGK